MICYYLGFISALALLCKIFYRKEGAWILTQAAFTYFFPLLILANDGVQFFSQDWVLLAQLVVAVAMLFYLSLDVSQRVLKVSGDLLSLHLVLTTPLEVFALQANRSSTSASIHCKIGPFPSPSLPLLWDCEMCSSLFSGSMAKWPIFCHFELSLWINTYDNVVTMECYVAKKPMCEYKTWSNHTVTLTTFLIRIMRHYIYCGHHKKSLPNDDCYFLTYNYILQKRLFKI